MVEGQRLEGLPELLKETAMSTMDRRQFLMGAGVAGLGVLGSRSVLTRGLRAPASAQQTVKIGYVTPETGSLAPFGQADAFVISQIRDYVKKSGGIKIGGKRYAVEIITKDLSLIHI